MSSRKDHIPWREKLASALSQMLVEVDGKLVPAIPRDDAKLMTAEEIISLYQFDHGIVEAIDGPTVHWNLTPRFIGDHRRKTAEVDLPQIAKTKRIAAAQEAFRRSLLAKSGQESAQTVEKSSPSRKIPSRPFPKIKRPMRVAR